MLPKVSSYLKIAFVGLFFSFVILGCGGGDKNGDTADSDVTKITYEEVPPGALPDVPAELGGEGFTGEGWLTAESPPIADPNAIPGGTFKMAIYEFPTTLRIEGKDANNTFTRMINNMCYESLIGTHSLTQEVVPGLATHWQISEDKKTYRFRINPKARWSDGSRLTADDVLATWKLKTDAGILAPYVNALWNKFEEPIVESPYIISVTAKELNWKFFIYFGGMNILPAKYLNKVDGKEYLEKYQFKMMPVSGLYFVDVKDIVKGKSISIRKRDDYWDKDHPNLKGAYNFEKIKFVVVKDERLIFEKFKKGETDFYQVGRAQWWVEETNFDEVERGLIQKRKIYNNEPQGIQGLVFNMRERPFSDKRVRQAIVHLYNRKKLIENLFFNEYLYLDSYYPGSVYENPNNPKYRFDPDKAVRLLNEAGYVERNQEGWLLGPDGQPFVLDLMITKPMERIYTVIQEDFAKVGIKLNLRLSSGQTMFKMVNERNFKIHHQAWGGLFFPNPENDVSSWTADPKNTNNLAGVKNDRIDELIKAYNVEFDFQKRVDMIREVDSILMDIQPWALGWYAPFHRILYWNRFGHPEWYFARTGDYSSIIAYWWIDPEKEATLEKAMKDPSIKMEVGKTEVMYWPEYNQKHGRSYEIKGM